MIDYIGAIAGMSGIAIILSTFAQALASNLRQRLLIAGIAGGWVGLASHMAAIGALTFSPEHPVPMLGILAAAPLLILGFSTAISARLRAVLLAIPLSLLVGINVLRVVGVLFLALAAVGRLSGPFPYFAGLGDILTGVMAVPLALSIARNPSEPRPSLARWNALGALDLIVAVALGLTSAAGPLRIFHAGAGSSAIQYLPFSLVPTVMVPFYLSVHAIVAAKLAASRRAPVVLRRASGRAAPFVYPRS
jgi:hypothetical protein